MKRIAIGILVLMFSACSINTSKEIDLDKVTFSYRDDAYIFFRNIRQSNYDIEVLEDAGWRIYRHEDYPEDTSAHYFKTALVVNWRVNKAYPIIEMAKAINKEGLEITWKDPKSNKSGTLALSDLQRKYEMELLTHLYNHIINEHELSWKPEGEKSTTLFFDSEQKEAFRITMYDFYRLTGIL